MRAPIVVVLGHANTGKTLLLDRIRHTQIQFGEASGITQQIGSTFLTRDVLIKRTEVLHRGKFDMDLPGLIVVDTPGHESFSNLRARGASLCDMAILVVDMLHGMEPQTVESIKHLQEAGVPFVVALNQLDRLDGWFSVEDDSFKNRSKAQKPNTLGHLDRHIKDFMLQCAETGLNAALYRDCPADYIPIVPTSAKTGEGLPDLLALLVQIAQKRLRASLEPREELRCSVLEIKQIEGMGTTIDALLVDGSLKLKEEILVCGFNGPIRTKIRGLLLPDLHGKTWRREKKARGAIGVKILADGLDQAVAGSQLYKGDEDPKKVQAGVTGLFERVREQGVSVQASTLGALEALVSFLESINVPVGQVHLGPIHRKHVKAASVYLERDSPRRDLACILAFNVPIQREVRKEAEERGVTIFTSEVIYHLQDAYMKFLEQLKEEAKRNARSLAVFPAHMTILEDGVFRDKNPMLLGVKVESGWLRVGAPVIALKEKGKGKDKVREVVEIGRLFSIQKDGEDVKEAIPGDKVAVKISGEGKQVGRHFEPSCPLYIQITRENVDCLKEHYREELKTKKYTLVPLLNQMKVLELFEH